jgi:hypothetical protein
MSDEDDDVMDQISSMDHNEKTKSTAIDAFASKLSASRLGYFSDQYLPILLRFIHRDMRKQPIINRGKYLIPNTIILFTLFRILHSCPMHEICD